MTRLALGLIETIGLPAAVAAADTAVKAAHVHLLGYELARGDGLVTVKILGDVGAVRAGVEAGAATAQAVGSLWAKHVIARPHEEVEKLLRSRENVGEEGEGSSPDRDPPEGEGKGEGEPAAAETPGPIPGVEPGEPEREEQPPEEYLDRAAAPPHPFGEKDTDFPLPAGEDEPGPWLPGAEDRDQGVPAEPEPPSPESFPGAEEEEEYLPPGETPGEEEFCNLCGDPACPRRKGEPRVKCIHHEEQ